MIVFGNSASNLKPWDKCVVPNLSSFLLLWLLAEYSWMIYGSWESDGLLHIFPKLMKSPARVRERGWESLRRMGSASPGAPAGSRLIYEMIPTQRCSATMHYSSTPAAGKSRKFAILEIQNTAVSLSNWRIATVVFDKAPSSRQQSCEVHT